MCKMFFSVLPYHLTAGVNVSCIKWSLVQTTTDFHVIRFQQQRLEWEPGSDQHAIVYTLFPPLCMYISSGRVCRPFQTLSPETPQIKLFNRVPRTNYESKEAQGRKSNAARDWKAAESVITVMFGCQHCHKTIHQKSGC